MLHEETDLKSTQPTGHEKSTLTALVSSKQLGDVTLLEPLTRLLAARSGQPVALFVKEAFRPLVELMSHATWGPDVRGPFNELWATSWGGKTAVQAFKLRAKKKILFYNRVEQRRWWYRWVFDEFRMERHGLEYWGHYFWRMAGGVSADFQPSSLKMPPESWRTAHIQKSPYLVLVPTSAWPSKLWGIHQWATLVAQLSQDSAYPRNLIMLGGVQEFEKQHCAAIETLSADRLVNLCGKTTLKEYLHTLAGAAAVVTVDGSASHLAQAFGRPVVTLFGPTQDQRWHHATPRHEYLATRHFSADQKNAHAGIVPVASVTDALARVMQT